MVLTMFVTEKNRDSKYRNLHMFTWQKALQ